MRRRVLSLLVVFALLPACQGAPAKNAFDEPFDAHSRDKLHAVLWMRESAEFAAACRQAFAAARNTLEAAAGGAAIEALPNRAPAGAKLAVIADLDETILDNVGYQEHQARDGVEYGEAGWTQWVDSGRVQLLPGAREFLQRATAVADVYYVSNRTEPAHVEATIAALAEADAELGKQRNRLLLRTKDGPSNKQPRRDKVASTHRVVLLLGDDLGDFVTVPKVDAGNGIAAVVAARKRLVEDAAAKWGVTWIVLPNPAYGSWLRVYEGADTDASHRQRLGRLQGDDAWRPTERAR